MPPRFRTILVPDASEINRQMAGGWCELPRFSAWRVGIVLGRAVWKRLWGVVRGNETRRFYRLRHTAGHRTYRSIVAEAGSTPQAANLPRFLPVIERRPTDARGPPATGDPRLSPPGTSLSLPGQFFPCTQGTPPRTPVCQHLSRSRRKRLGIVLANGWCGQCRSAVPADQEQAGRQLYSVRPRLTPR